MCASAKSDSSSRHTAPALVHCRYSRLLIRRSTILPHQENRTRRFYNLDSLLMSSRSRTPQLNKQSVFESKLMLGQGANYHPDAGILCECVLKIWRLSTPLRVMLQSRSWQSLVMSAYLLFCRDATARGVAQWVRTRPARHSCIAVVPLSDTAIPVSALFRGIENQLIGPGTKRQYWLLVRLLSIPTPFNVTLSLYVSNTIVSLQCHGE